MAADHPAHTVAPSSDKRYLLVIKNVSFLYSHFWFLAEAVRDAGWEVWIAAGKNADTAKISDAGMKYLSLPVISGMGGLVSEIKVAIALYAMLGSVRPEAIHFIYLKNVLTGGIVARVRRAPAVLGAVTGLGTLFADERSSYRILRRVVLAGLRFGFRGRNAVIAVENSDDMEELIQRGGIHRDRTRMIHGAGVAPHQYTFEPWQGTVPVICCVSRMIRYKGIGDLLEAARILRARGIAFELWLAGDIDNGNPASLKADELRAVEREGIAKWLGRRQDIPALLRQTAVFCLPTYYREGLPRVLVEAGAAGRPSVTTNVPGCREIIRNGINGSIVPPRNPRALADALQDLLLDRGKRDLMGLAARRIFESTFALSAVLADFNECYELLGIDLKIRTDHAKR